MSCSSMRKLDGDEIFTLRDPIDPWLSNPQPLLYFLNYTGCGHWCRVMSLGSASCLRSSGCSPCPRSLVARRLVRAALFGTLLLTVTPSTSTTPSTRATGSLAFLLSAVYPFAIYLGIRDRNPVPWPSGS